MKKLLLALAVLVLVAGCLQQQEQKRLTIGAGSISSCQTISVSDTYTLSTNLSINNSNCLTISAPNVTIDCAGYSITGNNVTGPSFSAVISNQFNTTTINCIVKDFGRGIDYSSGSSFGNISNLTLSNALIFINGVNHSISQLNISAFASNAPAVSFSSSARNNTLFDSYLQANSSGSCVVSDSFGSNNLIYNNTLVSLLKTTCLVRAEGTNDTFYWNNFTNTTGEYVFQIKSPNFYNTTINGQPAGNFWPDVLNGSVPIYGNISSPFAGYYYGSVGSGYPRNVSSFFGNVIDYAPLTPFQTASLNVTAGAGGTAVGNSSGFAPPANRSINASFTFPYIFQNWTVVSGNCTVLNQTNVSSVQINDNGGCLVNATSVLNGTILNVSFCPTIARIQFRPIHIFQQNVLAVNESASVGAFCINNPYNFSGVVRGYLTANVSGFSVKAGPAYNQSGMLTLTTSPQNLSNSSGLSNTTIWVWADFNNPATLMQNFTVRVEQG